MNYLAFVYGFFLCVLVLSVGSFQEVLSGADNTRCVHDTTDAITLKDIDKFIGCEVLNGSIIIKNSTFEDISPNDLVKYFGTVKNITGYLHIEAYHPDFKNLSFFRNLEYIEGDTPGQFVYTLNIDQTSLESLELLSLKQIKGEGGVAIVENKDLCYSSSVDWKSILDTSAQKIVAYNRNLEDCEKDGCICDPQCSEQGCWGSGPEKCLSCKNYQQGNNCVEKCDKSDDSCKGCPSQTFEDNGDCLLCHEQCNGCNGPGNKNCIFCKNVKEEESCVQVCPQSKYSSRGECLQCLGNCTYGCFRTEGGSSCNNCSRSVDNQLLCNHSCPTGYFQRLDSNNQEDILCIKCHEECEHCFGPGPDKCSSCKNIKLYKHYNDGISNGRTHLTCITEFKIPDDYPACKNYSSDSLEYHCYTNHYEIILAGANFTILKPAIIAVVIVLAAIMYKNWKDRKNDQFGDNIGQYVQKGALYTDSAMGPVNFAIRTDNSTKPLLLKVLNGDLINDRDDLTKNIEKITNLRHRNLLQTGFKLSENKISAITELMPFGSVLDFIKDEQNKNQINPTAIHSWLRQIAEGMLYLEECSVVHRNLSARNVLLYSDQTVKIKDFALLSLLQPTDRQSTWSWLAPECITRDIFTNKSDVWAFGVTACELLTLGGKPEEFLTFHHTEGECEVGLSLSKPNICSDEMYELLKSCWMYDLRKRPTFKELSDKLKQMEINPDEGNDLKEIEVDQPLL